jgi:hypothetical protein
MISLLARQARQGGKRIRLRRHKATGVLRNAALGLLPHRKVATQANKGGKEPAGAGQGGRNPCLQDATGDCWA